MLQTIKIGSCVQVQGMFLRRLADGRIAVKVGGRIFHGKPITPFRA